MEKMAAAGYSLTVDTAGRVAFSVKGEGGSGSVSGTAKVNDGRWHHVLAECDRKSGTLTLYVDGKKDVEGAGVGPEVTLANAGDLYVGGTPKGRCLAGTLDFLRIALGTLTDAKTTIEELSAWEFDGPFLRDFVRRAPGRGGHREGGLRPAIVRGGGLQDRLGAGRRPALPSPPGLVGGASRGSFCVR
jgi:hypothetical protein